MNVCQAHPGSVVWITGLSGTGKSTVARELVEMLKENRKCVVLLDGDDVRAAVSDPNTGHDRKSRLVNAMRICRLAKLMSGQGLIVVVATMSLFREVHEWNRLHFSNYLEVFLKVDWEILKSRDARGIYSRAASGAVDHVVGVHLEYDEPGSPHLVLTNNEGIEVVRNLATKVFNELFNNE